MATTTVQPRPSRIPAADRQRLLVVGHRHYTEATDTPTWRLNLRYHLLLRARAHRRLTRDGLLHLAAAHLVLTEERGVHLPPVPHLTVPPGHLGDRAAEVAQVTQGREGDPVGATLELPGQPAQDRGPVYIGPSAYGWSSGTPGGRPGLPAVHRWPARVAGAVALWGTLGAAVWVHPGLALALLVSAAVAAVWDSRRRAPRPIYPRQG